MVKLDLDPDSHSEKLKDPDPHKMNADPQPCSQVTNMVPIVLNEKNAAIKRRYLCDCCEFENYFYDD